MLLRYIIEMSGGLWQYAKVQEKAQVKAQTAKKAVAKAAFSAEYSRFPVDF